MNEHRKLALRKERLSELTSHELQAVAGGECDSKGCGLCLRTAVTCADLLTLATCTCPTGPTCVCPTEAGAGCL